MIRNPLSAVKVHKVIEATASFGANNGLVALALVGLVTMFLVVVIAFDGIVRMVFVGIIFLAFLGIVFKRTYRPQALPVQATKEVLIELVKHGYFYGDSKNVIFLDKFAKLPSIQATPLALPSASKDKEPQEGSDQR